VRVINEHGQQVGVMETEEALRIARDSRLDLVEVGPSDSPPVCKIMDYGKYKYQLSKRHRQARHHVSDIKPIRVFPKIQERDLQVKLKNARRFLEKGYKVQINVQFRARENVHPELGRNIITRMATELEDIASIERAPLKEGRTMSALFACKKKGKGESTTASK